MADPDRYLTFSKLNGMGNYQLWRERALDLVRKRSKEMYAALDPLKVHDTAEEAKIQALDAAEDPTATGFVPSKELAALKKGRSEWLTHVQEEDGPAATLLRTLMVDDFAALYQDETSGRRLLKILDDRHSKWQATQGPLLMHQFLALCPLPEETPSEFCLRSRLLSNGLSKAGLKQQEQFTVTMVLQALSKERPHLSSGIKGLQGRLTGTGATLEEVGPQLDTLVLELEHEGVPSAHVATAGVPLEDYKAMAVAVKELVEQNKQLQQQQQRPPTSRPWTPTAPRPRHTFTHCPWCGKRAHAGGPRSCPSKPNAGGVSSPFNPYIQNPGNRALSASRAGGAMEWCLDSGCRPHMSPGGKGSGAFHNYRELHPHRPVRFAGKDAWAPAVGIGDVSIWGPGGEVVLRGVLHVPKLAGPLFSVSTAVDEGYSVSFDPGPTPGGHRVHILLNKRVVLTCTLYQGLYFLDAQPHHASRAHASDLATAQAWAWHRKLGHMGFSTLANLSRQNLLPGCTVTPREFLQAREHHLCEPCVQGRLTAISHPLRTNPTSLLPCERVHSDVVVFPCGTRYLVTLLDEATGYSRVTFMKSKGDAAERTKDGIEWFEKQSGFPVQYFKTDGGLEYVTLMQPDGYFSKKGIQPDRAPGYTQQNNGRAEKLGRDLVETAQCMLLDSGDSRHSLKPLGAFYTQYAVHLANDLRNATPRSNTQLGPNPHSAFLKRPVSLELFQRFGCRCWVHVPKALRKKMEPHAQPGRFLGFEHPLGSGVYKVLLDASQRMTTTMTVSFDDIPWAYQPLRPSPGPAPPPVHSGEQGEKGEQGEQGEQGDPVVPVSNPTPSPTPLPFALPEVIPALPPLLPVPPPLPPVALPPAPPPVPPAPPAPPQVPPPDLSLDLPDVAPLVQLQTHTGREQRERRAPERFDPSAKQAAATAATTAATHLTIEDTSPNSVWEALSRPDAGEWRKAIKAEIASCESYKVWTKCELPAGRVALPSRLVLEHKRDGRYKARLVAGGHRQRQGVDYNDTYAPVCSYRTVRAILALAAHEDLELRQFDIRTAFLNADLEEEVYMRAPTGAEHLTGPGEVLRLNKALYGLHQAQRSFSTHLSSKFTGGGFVQSKADPSLWILHDGSGAALTMVYVDDGIVAARTAELAEAAVALIGSYFEIRKMGEPRDFLGIDITRDRTARTITISQESKAVKLVREQGLVGELRHIPMTPEKYAALRSTQPGEPLTDQTQYQTVLGVLLYLAMCTRPDIASVVIALSSYASNPSWAHREALDDVVRYVGSTAARGITYGATRKPLDSYCDSNFAACVDTRRSTSGWTMLMYGGAVSWQSKKQPTVAVSTMEAEYQGYGAMAREASSMAKLLCELVLLSRGDFPMQGPIVVAVDNKAALALTKENKETQRSKHIDIIHHYCREKVLSGELKFVYCKSADNVSDCLTKALSRPLFEAGLRGLGMIV